MNLIYKIYYTVLVPCQEPNREMVITAREPIRALDIFHRNVQSNPKAKLLPQDYKINGLVHRYQDMEKRWIESIVDLPNTPNPLIINIDGSQLRNIDATVEMPLDDKRLPKEGAIYD